MSQNDEIGRTEGAPGSSGRGLFPQPQPRDRGTFLSSIPVAPSRGVARAVRSSIPRPVPRWRKFQQCTTLPPPDESPIDREVRLKAEIDAKKVSDSIDDTIRLEKNERKRSKTEVNVLLLGQSESGKSTTLKQFQLLHSPSAFSAERMAWRAVIYLNLVRSVRRILDALSRRPLKLQPLLDLENRLMHLLSSPDEDEATHLGPLRPGRPAPTTTTPQKKHTSTNWEKAFSLGSKSKSPKSAHSGETEDGWEDPDDPVHVLNSYAPAMQELWRDHQEKRLRLEESSGFYLDEIPRITAKKYIPTDADILKARLKTIGVVEHTFSVPSGSNRGVEWRIYDVGGARDQRQAWAPYFEDVNAIIFLAPISAFDQVLAEDSRVNRLEDSLMLWESIVTNKLLANLIIVLFLNKCDLLEAKLEAGVRLDHHMAYGDRPNDYQSVLKYFRNKFGVIYQSCTPNKERELYIHFTRVTDIERTAVIISSVRDIIIKGNLRNMRLE